ncbi:MAG: hypothetical protein JSU90_05800 [Nitrospiraceae bacterium]|nr:MAG: hypothetical protein JSU90_05800 [Nitrospiraceae bacterium]
MISITNLVKKVDKNERVGRDRKEPVQERAGVSVRHVSGLSQLECPPSGEKQKTADEHALAGVKITPTVMLTARALTREESLTLYEGAAHLAEETQSRSGEGGMPDRAALQYCIDKLIDQMMLHNEYLFEFLSGAAERHASSHAINVCMLAIKTGIHLGYGREELRRIGVLAYLHDLGMKENTDPSDRSPLMSRKILRRIKKSYPLIGSQIVKMRGLSERVMDTVPTLWEEQKGSHDPGKEKKTYPQVIALADIYDATMHPLQESHGLTPFKAMEEIVSLKRFFDYKIIKSFIEIVGIFPMGSIVRLSTDETGKVVRINPGYPTRPVVSIIYDREGNELDEERIVDLSGRKNVYISSCLMKEVTEKKT